MDTLFEELEILFNELGIPLDSKNYRIRCFAHIMNLSCQAMIRSIGDGDAIEYPSDSDSDDEDNQENALKKSKVLSVVAKVRKAVVAVRNSPQSKDENFLKDSALLPKLNRWLYYGMFERDGMQLIVC